MYKNILLTCCCVLLGVAGSASATATIIQPTAVVSEEYVYNSASSTIDNSRMTPAVNGGDSLKTAATAVHDFAGVYDGYFISTDPGGYPSDFFASLPGGDTDVDIVLDLTGGGDTAVAGIVLWQYTNTGGGPELVGNHARTIEVRVNTEAEGSATFAGAATTVTLLPVTDGDADPLNDLGGVNSAQIFALDSATSGRYAQLSITDNYLGFQDITGGGDRVGFSEVRFTDQSPFVSVTASNPAPYDTEPDVAIDTDLKWDNPGDYTATKFVLNFHVTEPNWLDTGNTTVVDPVVDLALDGDPNTTEADAPIALANLTTYYWRVISYEPNTVPFGHVGPDWSFTTITALPFITTQPLSETATSVDLLIEASNAEVYEWYQVGTPDTLVQTTGTLGVPGAASDTYTTGTEGYYYCVVTNTVSAITSDTVRVMTPRLVGHWKLDGDLTDSSVAGIWDGDYIDPNTAATNPDDSTVNYIIGADGIGQAVQFNGYNVVEVPDSNEFFDFHGQGLTVTAWILGPSGGDYKRPFNKGSYAILQHVSNSIEAIIEGGPGWQVAVPDVEASEGKWRFVAMTYDPDSAERTIYGIYDDDDVIDILHSTIATQTGTLAYDFNVLIGGAQPVDPAPLYNYDGSVDDVRVYNYALTASEIQGVFAEISAAPLCMDPADPTIAPYDFYKDCQVNLKDFAEFAAAWLLDSIVVGP